MSSIWFNRIASVLLALIWCWPLEHDQNYHLNDHYYVCISPEFNQWQHESISEGVALWNGMGETRFYAETNGLCNILIAPAVGKDAKRLEAALGDPFILGYADTRKSTIYLWMDKVYGSTDLVMLAAHEAGHMINQSHIGMDKIAVMNPYKRYYGPAHPHLYRADLEQYCHHFHCRGVDINNIPEDTYIERDVDPALEHNIDTWR